MEHYTTDNTQGYTSEELDALNAELDGLLADLASSTDGQATPDDVQALIKRHNDDVARR